MRLRRGWSHVSGQFQRHFDIILLLLAVCVCIEATDDSCDGRDYGYGSIVCVCSVKHCDTLGTVQKQPAGKVAVYESSQEGARFRKQVKDFTPVVSEDSGCRPGTGFVQLDRTQQFQEILGFGGAFTDSAGINILSIDKALQDKLLESYYSENGLDYSMGRVPMASCDFSTHKYSYDDVPGDFTLANFSLTTEDYTYKIPLIQRAMSMSSLPIRFFGSPWSPPAWMKTNNDMAGSGTLIGPAGGQYYDTWAQYFVKFLDAYAKENITFWGMTVQNEPIDGFIPMFTFQAMAFSPDMERDFIKMNLAPTLKAAGYGPDKLQVMIMDDQTPFLLLWRSILNDPELDKSVGGIALHWYFNSFPFGWILDSTHNRFPNKFLLSTEACSGSLALSTGPHVWLGSWGRAEDYAHDIIKNLRHWTAGWVDWNLALDTEGGPNWVNNFVDSPIIVNATAGEFYKQPMYYALAHFSKFLPPGSYRFKHIENRIGGLEIAAFTRPDQGTVLIVINRESKSYNVTISDEEHGQVTDTVVAHSFKTYVWW